MKKRWLILMGIALVVAIIGVVVFRQPKETNQLDIQKIHDQAAYGMTTKELRQAFGEPAKIESDPQKVHLTWQKQNETTSFMDELPSDFLQTIKRKAEYQPPDSRNFTSYYQYDPADLTYVRFFIQEDRVRMILFGWPKAGKLDEVERQLKQYE